MKDVDTEDGFEVTCRCYKGVPALKYLLIFTGSQILKMLKAAGYPLN